MMFFDSIKNFKNGKIWIFGVQHVHVDIRGYVDSEFETVAYHCYDRKLTHKRLILLVKYVKKNFLCNFIGYRQKSYKFDYLNPKTKNRKLSLLF